MSRKHRQVEGDTQLKVDDFKLINGIKRGIEKRLQAADIQTYAQLASLTPEQILLIVGKGKGYSIRRIKQENWIGQAQDLVPQNNRRKLGKRVTSRPTIRQHYENFTVELLLDEKNLARRTHIVHVQSGDADTWAGWEAQHLFNFVIRHTGVHGPSTKAATATPLKRNSAAPASILAEQASPVGAEMTSKISAVGIPEEHSESLPFFAGSQPKTPPSALTDALSLQSVPQQFSSTGDISGSIELLEWKVTLPEKNQTLHNIPREQAFDVSLTLEINNLSLPKISQLVCTAKFYAKKIGGKNRQPIGEIHKTLPCDPIVHLTIGGLILSKGIYRLEARITIQPAGMEAAAQQKIMSFLESGPLQIY
jgi:hypothetical protein